MDIYNELAGENFGVSDHMNRICYHIGYMLDSNNMARLPLGLLTVDNIKTIEIGTLHALVEMEGLNEGQLSSYKIIRQQVSKHTPELQNLEGREISLFLEVERMERVLSVSKQEMADMDVSLRAALGEMKVLRGADKEAYVRLRNIYTNFLEVGAENYDDEDDDEIDDI